MSRRIGFLAATAPLGVAWLLLFSACTPARGGESWHVTPGAGVLLFPGSQPAHDSLAGTLRLGYDLDAPVSLEFGQLAGMLDTPKDPGSDHQAVESVWTDVMLHLARWERLDPFLSAGGGVFWSDGRTLPDNRSEGVVPRLGAGFLYTLSEHWSARAGITVMSLQRPNRQGGFALAEAGLSY